MSESYHIFAKIAEGSEETGEEGDVFVQGSRTLTRPPGCCEDVVGEHFVALMSEAGYYAIVLGKPFEAYGIEQQAEIVRHAFLLRQGVAVTDKPPLDVYEALLPFSAAGSR